MSQEAVNKARFNGDIVDGRIVRNILRTQLIDKFKNYIHSTDDTDYLDDVLRGMEVIGAESFLKQMADNTDYINEPVNDKIPLTEYNCETNIIEIINSRRKKVDKLY